MNNDTICALATAPGGALGIIRISGSKAFDAVSALCSISCSSVEANTTHYTHLVDTQGAVIDEVMVTVFRSPHSYTGEDSVEISCHGSSYIAKKILEALVRQGCRMAEPGEFTKRAYLNGKLDLSQAEAVADLIASTNRATHQMALSQLRGEISTELADLRQHLLQLTTLLELELDFSDHEDLEFADRSELENLAQTIESHISRLAKSFETGKALKEGIPVAIVGKTNVGKSTLLNHLLKDDRAIVSDIHGTTRDTIEDTIDIHGVQFRFIDTAGLRQTTDTIEQIGIERTYAAISKARIVLWLIDRQPSNEEIVDMMKRTDDKKLIVIHNKIDLENSQISIPNYQTIDISAKKDIGIENLEEQIFEAANLPELTANSIIVTNARHYDALLRAHESIQRVLQGLQDGLSSDLLSEDLHLTLDILAEITGGQITPQETLNNIFSHFCVGK
ncbi:MAG: tRNA uridine-5-carboxymethylaminomethyl(34) synthesis GTPase MnmE [Prevotella sp.]|nr:tRNA uridine-5-carboxymethylaminomethyl(34) synthesis GTPase MnmE [Prevotella sp.]